MTGTAYTSLTRPVAQLEQLTAGLEALARAGTIPLCTDRPEWTSELEADRMAAGEVCTWCPMAGPCLSAGAATYATWSVWGGIDFGDPDQRRAAIRTHKTTTTTTTHN